MCCMLHDACYITFGVTYHFSCNNKDQAERYCDSLLCDCLDNLGGLSGGAQSAQTNIMILFCGALGCDT